MGMILRLARWGLWIGIVVWGLTTAVVLYLSGENAARHSVDKGLSQPVDAVLVLGGGIDGDGLAAYSSRRRVLGGVRLLNDGQARFLILCSGPDTNPPGLTGAELMRDHAVAMGAPEEALILETRSVSTFENLRFGFAMADERGFGRLAIVTDAFHVERARWLAAYLGRDDVELVAVPGLRRDRIESRVWSIAREALAWWYNLAKIGAWEALSLAGVGADARAELIR